MRTTRALCFALLALAACGCGSDEKPPYGHEAPTLLPGNVRQTWAVAPVIDLSGQKVDPILQADCVYKQLQEVQGLTVIPVNRVVEIYQALRIEKVQTEEQAALVCDLLNCEGLIVVSVTSYDPFEPPKLGASMQLFRRGADYRRPASVDPRLLVRQPSPTTQEGPRQPMPRFLQAVGMFDASNGSIRDAVAKYAAGRTDPSGPYGDREYFVDMERFCGFAYHSLIVDLLAKPGFSADKQ